MNNSASPLIIFCFRRDLRLHDNRALTEALNLAKQKGIKVQCIFIFDKNIIDKLKKPHDLRLQFIHGAVCNIKTQLQNRGSDIWTFYGKPQDVVTKILKENDVKAIVVSSDYEPYAVQRDSEIKSICQKQGVEFSSFKDQVIFEKDEILNQQGEVYRVFTAYAKKWKTRLSELQGATDDPLSLSKSKVKSELLNPLSYQPAAQPNTQLDLGLIEGVSNKHTKKPYSAVISLKDLGYDTIDFSFPKPIVNAAQLKKYHQTRDFPWLEQGTSHVGIHLRFGTLSIRNLVQLAQKTNETWLNELIWREFFMQLMWHFPHTETKCYRSEFEKIPWRENVAEFTKWCHGETGFPLVDAGMRELNSTGYMHNRVRMLAGSFLTKNLLMHWRVGERYFAEKLLDFDLSANVGNWQWVAGCGVDAAPYFRIFNPNTQIEKFDKEHEYIKRWVSEFGSSKYPQPMVDYKETRERAIRTFAKHLPK